MKVWSPIFATALLLAGVSAQIGVDIIQDDSAEPDLKYSEAMSGPGPCNGYPEYKDMPVNQAFYLGIHNAGSEVFEKQCHSTQTNSISRALNDGIRYLDINLCKSQGKLAICSAVDGTPSTKTLSSTLDEIFMFARESVQQFFVVNIKSENAALPANTKELEAVIDEICQIHSDATIGTDEYVKKECPFIYTHEKGPWPAMADVVDYYPDMAQWEGDGEIVGVRTKFMLTKSDTVTDTEGYKSAYFSKRFWRSLHKQPIQSTEDLRNAIRTECRIPAGGIALEAYTSTPCEEDAVYDPETIEDLILSRRGCNLNDSPLNTFISLISTDNYEKHLPYLKELEKRMMDINFAKWNGNYKMVPPSSFAQKKQQVERDEL